MRTLIVAPHMDDETLGCGGIIAKRKLQGYSVDVLTVTQPSEPMYSKDFIENENEECREALDSLGVDNVYQLTYPTTKLEEISSNELISQIKKILDISMPQEIFISHRGDIHKEHKIVSDACMVACRPKNNVSVKKIYSYEVLSETDWDIPNTVNAFIPNVYVDVSDVFQKKIDALRKYKSQVMGDYSARSIDSITSLARHRGRLLELNMQKHSCL